MYYLRRLTLLLLLAAYWVSLSKATILTGTLKNPDGTGANGSLYLSLSQQAALATTGGCGGPVEVVPTVEKRIAVSGGTFAGGISIYGNDCLLPQGTYYNVRFVDNNNNVLFTDRWLITGGSIDIGSIVSVVITGTTMTLGGVGVVLTQPSGDQTVVQPGTTKLSVNNLTVTNSLIGPIGMSCTNAGCVFLTGTQFPGGINTGPPSSANSQISIGSGGAFYNRVFSGGDANCTGIADGWIGIRGDTGEQQYCLGGVLYHAVGCSAVGTCVIGTNTTFSGGLTTTESQNSFIHVGPGGHMYMPRFTGEANCGGVTDGFFGLRTDSSPPMVEICLGNTTLHIPLTS